MPVIATGKKEAKRIKSQTKRKGRGVRSFLVKK